MNQTGALHPPQKTLIAFLNGELDDAMQSQVEAHIQACETCVNYLRTVPDDDLLKRIRTADTYTTGGATRMMPAEAFSLNTTGGLDDSPSDILVELVNHSRYRIVKPLGEGGMGVVYQAEHRVMERTVALKVIASRLVSHPGAVERFHQEVKAAARLSHRNIVTAHDAEQIGNLHFLVMEFVEGESLNALVARQGRLPIKRACYYIWQAALGLGHAHENGMVHRDIKPQNLMLTPQGVVKILDFGLARLAAQEGMDDDKTGLTAVGIAVGTPDYMAPEQARDSRSVDARADIYSLGATFYFLLTGQTLFPVGSALEKVLAHIERKPRPATDLRPDIPPEVANILNRMLEKNPANRYQTPGEVAEDLKQFLKQPTNPSSPESEVDNETPLISLMASVASLPPRRPNRRSASRGRKRQRAIRRALERHIKWIVPVMLFCGWFLWWMLHEPGTTPVQSPVERNSDRPQTATNAGGSQASTSVALPEVAGQWIDLMPKVNVDQAIQGQWFLSGGELHVNAEPKARLVLLHDLPAEYDFEIAFTRKSGRYSIAMIFPAGSGQATFEADAWGMDLVGIQNIGGRRLNDRQGQVPVVEITNGQRHVMLLKVRKNGVEGYLDGRPVSKYQGDGSDLSLLPEPWDLGDSSALGLGAFDAETTFHQIRIRPVATSRE